MEKYGEVTVAWTVQPKSFHSLGRSVTLPILLPAGATEEQVLAKKAELERLMAEAVSMSLNEGLKPYGKTLKDVVA